MSDGTDSREKGAGSPDAAPGPPDAAPGPPDSVAGSSPDSGGGPRPDSVGGPRGDRPVRDRIEVWALEAVSALARLLPRRWVPLLGARIGDAAWLVSGRRRRTALGNLAIAFGDESPESGHRAIAIAAFRQFGRLLVEGLLFDRLTAADAEEARGVVRYNGLEHIRGAYGSGRGVILFSAHFGNWELVAMMQGYLGMPLTMVTRPLDNSRLERLLAARRSPSGNTIVHKKRAMRPLLSALGAGGGVAIVIDQNVRDGSAVFVPFFGRAAATTPALGLLALRTGAAVIPVFAVPEPDGSYRVDYLPEIVPVRTDDRAADALALTARCTAIIEEQVRTRPEAWLWMHERWKTRPIEEVRAARRAREHRTPQQGQA